MIRWILAITITFVALSLPSDAQDLNAKVQLLSPRVQNTNKNSLKVLRLAIQEFLNGRKWTEHTLNPAERINCTFVITINEWDGASNYRAEAQILSSRPVYGTTYQSPMLTMADKNFDFSYVDSQPLDYNDQSFLNNLSSLLAYYAYTIIGIDADSFSHLGGSTYFERARTVCNNAQSSGFIGWKAAEDFRNRFWLADNLNRKDFMPFRDFSYFYHRKGLDVLSVKPEEARATIIDVLPMLLKTDLRQPGAYYNQIFFSTKSDELLNILRAAPYKDRATAWGILSKTDPANSGKYYELNR